MTISIDDLVPGGIKQTDHVHHGTNDGTCSRCRKPCLECECGPRCGCCGGDDIPLLAMRGDDLWIYCRDCTSDDAWAAEATLAPD